MTKQVSNSGIADVGNDYPYKTTNYDPSSLGSIHITMSFTNHMIHRALKSQSDRYKCQLVINTPHESLSCWESRCIGTLFGGTMRVCRYVEQLAYM